MEFRVISTDALRFWERGRLLFNLALVSAFTVGLLLGPGIAALNAMILFASLSGLVVLAVAANLVYCIAYPVDVFIQHSDFREAWRRWRWVALAVGTACACFPAGFIAYIFALPVFAG